MDVLPCDMFLATGKHLVQWVVTNGHVDQREGCFMDQFVVFAAQVALFSVFPILLAGLKRSIRLIYFYIYISLVLLVGGFLGAVYSIPLTSTITISGGSLAYGALMMSTMVLVITERDLDVVRTIIRIVIAVNVVKFFLFLLISWTLTSEGIINPFNTSPLVFGVSVKFMIIGGVLIIAELLLLIFLFERIKTRIDNHALLSFLYLVFFIAVLCLDGVLFPLIAFPFGLALVEIIAGGVQSKLVLALAYSLPIVVYLVLFREDISKYKKSPIRLPELLIAPRADLIEEIERSQQALGESERKYSLIFDESAVPTVLLKLPDAVVVEVNGAYVDLVGFTRQEILGKSALELGIIKSNVVAETTAKWNSQDSLFGHETRISTKTGQERIVLTNGNPLTLNGQPYALGTLQDITERKQIAEALREKNEFVNNLLENSPVSIYVVGAGGQMRLINRRWEADTGFPRADVLGLSLEQVFPAQVARKFQADNQKVLETGKVLTIEEFIDPHHLYTVKFPLRDRLGEIVAVGGMSLDITERKQAERKVQESEQKYRDLVENSQDLIWAVDAQGAITFMNGASEHIYGYTPQELIGTHWTNLAMEWDEQDAHRIVAEIAQQGGEVTGQISKMRHRSGEEVILRANAVQHYDQAGNYTGSSGTSQDITHIVEAAEEIRASREQLRNLNNYLQVAIETERTLIAREIHDEFGQMMTGLKMDLAWLERNTELTSRQQERIQAIDLLVNEAINTIRRISSELRPGILDDLGLFPALEWLSGEYSRRADLTCLVDLPSEEPNLDPDRKTALFRIFQESMTNVIRHAHATQVETSLTMENHHLIMTIVDNGVGISGDELRDPNSFGLLGMRERAAQWGGTVEVFGEKSRGTTVLARVPLAQTHQGVEVA